MLCSGPFMCSPMSGKPLAAPPALFRSQAEPFYSGSYSVDGPRLLPSCTMADSAAGRCDTPGYKIQWPYIQTAASNATARIPPGLLGKCALVRGSRAAPLFQSGDRGWVWDPFEMTVLDEYLDCSAACGGVALSECSVPFTDGGAPFHFSPEWYAETNAAVKACLRTRYLVGGRADPGVFDAVARERALGRRAPQDVSMRMCMATACARGGAPGLAQSFFALLGSCTRFSDLEVCRCAAKGYWSEWALASFYSPQAPRPSACSAGPYRGQPCDSDYNCAAADADPAAGADAPGRCEPVYPGQVPLSRSARYGCFFEGPVAGEEAEPVVNTCAVYNTAKAYSSSAFDVVANRRELSTRNAFITVFLVKEGNYITGHL